MHRGHKKAVVAVAHAMLVTAYQLLDRQLEYREPGIDYFERRHAERTMRGAVFRLQDSFRPGWRTTAKRSKLSSGWTSMQ